MSADTVVRARIDSDTKARATEPLQAMKESNEGTARRFNGAKELFQDPGV